MLPDLLPEAVGGRAQRWEGRLSITFTESITLAQMNCGQCGGTYAINERYRQHRLEQGGFWKCPYCNHSWGYGESENQRLQKALEEKQKAVVAAKCETLAANQARELAERKLSKLSRRVRCGLCPCCNRSFQNLQRHMKTKHPEAA
jgi:hypothetical protein